MLGRRESGADHIKLMPNLADAMDAQNDPFGDLLESIGCYCSPKDNQVVLHEHVQLPQI